MTARKSNTKSKDFYVYLHRKATTGEVFYVGKGHGRRAFTKSKRNKHWQNTVKKHGFTVEFYATGLQEWYALEIEIELIAKFGRIDNGTGCLVNWTDGGEGSSGFNHSDKSKEAIRIAVKNRVVSELTRKKLSSIQKTKEIISNLGEIFRCGNDAAYYLRKNGWPNATQSGIAQVVGKVGFSSYGRTWNFKKNGIPTWVPSARVAINKVLVINKTTSQVFDSATDAAASIGKNNNSNIIACCKGRIKTAYGYCWGYA